MANVGDNKANRDTQNNVHHRSTVLLYNDPRGVNYLDIRTFRDDRQDEGDDLGQVINQERLNRLEQVQEPRDRLLERCDPREQGRPDIQLLNDGITTLHGGHGREIGHIVEEAERRGIRHMIPHPTDRHVFERNPRHVLLDLVEDDRMELRRFNRNQFTSPEGPSLCRQDGNCWNRISRLSAMT